MPTIAVSSKDMLPRLHQAVLWLVITIFSYLEQARFDGIGYLAAPRRRLTVIC